jgi:hypothetical protein
MAYKKILKTAVIAASAVVFYVLTVLGADYFVTYQNGTDKMLMPCNLWYAGCAPTAASMVLGYWDNYGLMGGGISGKYQKWGKLQQYYMDYPAAQQKQAASGGFFWGGDTDGIPSLIYDLAYSMNTDTEGATQYANIKPGIMSVANSRGYDGEWSRSYTSYTSSLWSRVMEEINAGRPIVWSASSTESGHSIACWGYTDSKYVIVYNTWDEMRHDYYYAYYTGVTGVPAVYMQLDTVDADPGMSSDIELVSPDGGEIWYQNTHQNISWTQYGNDINTVRIYYSVDGGKTWQFGTDAASAKGDNAFSWHVPDMMITSRMKIRIEGWQGDGTHFGDDGSRNNFHCAAATFTVTPTITPTGTITATHTISPTFTHSPTVTATPAATPVFCMSFSGVFPNPVAGETRFEYGLCRDALVYLYIYNISGELVRKISQTGTAGNNVFYWDCKNSSGKKAARGIYIYAVEAVSDNDRGRKTGKLAVR